MEVVTGWVLFSGLVGFIASARGHSGVGFTFLSLLISPLITIVIVLCLPNKKQQAIEAKRHQELLAVASGRAAYNDAPVYSDAAEYFDGAPEKRDNGVGYFVTFIVIGGLILIALFAGL